VIRIFFIALAVSLSTGAHAISCLRARSVASQAGGDARAATVTARDVGNITVSRVVEAYIEPGLEHLDADPMASVRWFSAASALSEHIHNPYASIVLESTAHAAESAAVCAVDLKATSS
jgi:hypothetical protein